MWCTQLLDILYDVLETSVAENYVWIKWYMFLWTFWPKKDNIKKIIRGYYAMFQTKKDLSLINVV